MYAPRVSQNAEAARSAAAQAEFNEKKWVWVPDEKEGYLAGWVVKEEDDFGDVIMAAGGDIRHLPLYALSKMNPPKFDRVEDIADLTFLNEASVVHNLRLRYGSGAIYTYSGLFLVAINPYQSLPLYSDSIIAQYRGKRRDENPPHIFAIAERAWVSMGDERENQSILITGESGAGKTESTKKVIQYLAAIATDTHLPSSASGSIEASATGRSSSRFGHGHSQSMSDRNAVMPVAGLPRNPSFRSHKPTQSMALTHSTGTGGGSGFSSNSKARLGLLERQILQANPILEAFGNAQTQRNNNSSRFGKFVRISFAPDGSIAGANIDWYLLEKSRVVGRAEAERSFHVFYQLLEGADRELRKTLLLEGGVEDYEYLNKSRREVDGINDYEEWTALKNALDTVGFSTSEQLDFFRIVASILHIGNISITSTRSDDALMPDPGQAERVCHILGLPVAEFQRAVLRPRVLAGREWVTQARTGQQALDELSAMAKTLYERSFGSLVERINRALDRPASKANFIGVLDIAGFEIFELNGYEQLLINYTNEKLQQFFNHHMFVLEQEEYAREGIEWEYVNFGLDLQPTVDLIEGSGVGRDGGGGGIGVLSLLDEECIMPKASDGTFTAKLHALWAGDLGAQEGEGHPGREKYEPSRFAQGFLVHHYAGKVEYSTEGWLEKNKDPLNDNITRVLASSSNPAVKALFADYAAAESAVGNVAMTFGKKRAVKKGAFRTVGQRHKEQLSSLMGTLYATQPHFVRCIVPNPLKRPGRIAAPLVLDQLRCNGVLEGIRIARLGYPNRLPFVEFRARYEVLAPGAVPRGYMDGRKACLRMVEALELDGMTFRIGTSKIFFKAGVLAELEERRDGLLMDIFGRLQAAIRRFSARRQMKKILNRAMAIRTVQRNARIYAELRDWPWWRLYTKVRPLLAATRNDEELRRKESELLLARERAERDQREKEAMEGLRMRLEAEKRRVDEQLERERQLAVDKDTLLARSKAREGELEEEVAALEADLDARDAQLDRALAIQRESEDKHRTLQAAFDEAAEHLVRLEAEQKDWAEREGVLAQQLEEADRELEGLEGEREGLVKEREDLRRLVRQAEEDMGRGRERMEGIVRELEGKLANETRNRDVLRGKSEANEQDARQAREQLAELTRTATDYADMIKSREADITRLRSDLEASKSERSRLAKDVANLEGRIATLSAEVDSLRSSDERHSATQSRLQDELDELRSLLQAKTSEESAQREVQKRTSEELQNLRAQVAELQQLLDEEHIAATEAQAKLKVELDTATREHSSLLQSHRSLSDRAQALDARLKTAEAQLSEAEKAKRSLESELQSLRTRQIDVDTQLAEVSKAKGALERQVAAAHAKAQDFEDTALQLEREKNAQDRDLERVKQQLEVESAKRAQAEKTLSGQKQELVSLRDKNAKHERELNKTLTDLKNKEWEVKQLESRQDKTIVEHVHVLQEAKRVTDAQLAEARKELQAQDLYIKSLEKVKQRLLGEAEDLARATEQEHVQMRSKEKAIRAVEEKAAQAQAFAEDQRRGREAAESNVRRLQADVQSAHDQIAEVTQQFLAMRTAKDALETDLARIADETESTSVSAASKASREADARIAKLERQLEEANMARETAQLIREHVDRQHEEIRKLVMAPGSHDDTFRDKLLRELARSEEQIDSEMRARNIPVPGIKSTVTPSSKRASTNGTVRERVQSLTNASPTASPRKSSGSGSAEVASLKQQMQVLEIKMAASDRVRQHLESSLRELTAELDNSDGSKASLQAYRARLAKENSRLGELLSDEAEARRAAQQAQLTGVQEMWTKFQSQLDAERENYARLEESRKALVVQQKNAQLEADTHKRANVELAQTKKKLQHEVTDLKDRLESETLAKKEETMSKRQALQRLQDLEVASTSSSSAQLELREAVEAFKNKAETYRIRLEELEIEKIKLERSEAVFKRSLADQENTLNATAAERDGLSQRLKEAEIRLQEFESRMEEIHGESADMVVLRKRLAEETEDERRQWEKELADRDHAADMTRTKYQQELAQLSEELKSQRDGMSKLREELRKTRSDYDELQVRYDDEVYAGGAWKKERERLETKISDLSRAYDAATGAQAEQQAQIVSLHSNVRELRSVLNDAEADRSLLQKARRNLQLELETMQLDNADASRMGTDRELQTLLMQKQDLERTLDEHADRVEMANDRQKKAEAHAQDIALELGRIRVENSELDKANASLEKQIKEAQLRIVDLETRAYSRTPGAAGSTNDATVRSLKARIDELQNELASANSAKARAGLSKDREATLRLADADRTRMKLEDEVRAYEEKVAGMRRSLESMQTTEGELQLAKRRAEREATDLRQRSLNLEHEVERLRARLDRSATPGSIGSPRR